MKFILANFCCIVAAQYPHYLAGAGPHDLQAAAAAGAYGSLHNNLPPALNTYPRPPLVSDNLSRLRNYFRGGRREISDLFSRKSFIKGETLGYLL